MYTYICIYTYSSFVVIRDSCCSYPATNGDPRMFVHALNPELSNDGRERTTTSGSSFCQAPSFLAIRSSIVVHSSTGLVFYSWNHEPENNVR